VTLIIAAAFIAGAILGVIAMGVICAGKAIALNDDLARAEAEIERIKPLAKHGEKWIASQLKASLASAEKRAKAIV
jgi:hypothetical protein